MLDTIHQQGPANHLHILLIQGPLESPVSQDVLPPAPADSENTEGVGGRGTDISSVQQESKRQDIPHPLTGVSVTPKALS